MNPSINNYSIKHHQPRQDSGESDLAGLLSLSKKNVESRIKGLEAEIETRQQLSDQALSALSTHKAQLRERARQVHYLGALGEHQDFTKQIARLEEALIKEMTACFSDVSRLREKLQEAKEELAIEQQRLTLAIPESCKSQPTATPIT